MNRETEQSNRFQLPPEGKAPGRGKKKQHQGLQMKKKMFETGPIALTSGRKTSAVLGNEAASESHPIEKGQRKKPALKSELKNLGEKRRGITTVSKGRGEKA